MAATVSLTFYCSHAMTVETERKSYQSNIMFTAIFQSVYKKYNKLKWVAHQEALHTVWYTLFIAQGKVFIKEAYSLS
jgi:hypothetical protein